MAFWIFSNFSLFLLIFDLAIPGLGKLASAPVSICISAAWILSRGGMRIDVLRISGKMIFAYCAIFFFVALRLLFSLAEETSFLFSAAKSSVIFIASLLYVKAFLFEGTGRQIVNVFFLNAIICLIAGTYTPLLDYIYIFKAGSVDPGFIPYRNAFLSGSGYYGIGAPFAIVFVLAVILLLSERVGRRVLDLVKILFIAIAGILAARTVFVGIAFGIMYVLYRKPAYIFPTAAILGVGVLSILSFEQTAQYSDWIFEIFEADSSMSTGSKSTDHLSTMYFMPDVMTFLFGDGKYSNGEQYYMETDAGYMRQMLFGGFPVTLLALSIPVILARISKSPEFIFFIFPLVYILHIKGNFIYNSPSGMPVLIVLAFWMRFYMNGSDANTLAKETRETHDVHQSESRIHGKRPEDDAV